MLFLSLILVSCTSDESTNIEKVETFEKLQFDSQKFNSLKEKKSKNRISDKVNFGLNLKKGGSLDSFILTTTAVDANNLNNLFPSLPISVDILAVTVATDTVNNASGILVHSIKEDGTMELEAFEKDKTGHYYNLIEFPAKIVNAFKLDNLLFVSKNLFPNYDLETLVISDITSTPHNSKYDDVALLAFSVNNKIGLTNNKSSNSKNQELTNYIQKPCAVAVHHCRNGSDIATECQPMAAGCRVPTCARQSVSIFTIENGLTNEYNTIEANLPGSELYQVRDELLTTPSGEFYTDAYYSISSHFNASLNVELLFDISSNSFTIGEIINAFLSDDEHYVLTNKNYNKIINIAQKSSRNSTSIVYKNVMSDLIESTSVFKGRSIGEIKVILNQLR